MRGPKSAARDRCTLHVKHLKDFIAFIGRQPEWKILPSTAHEYEVLHVTKVDRRGDGPHSFVYRRDRHEHLTVQEDLVPYVKQFLKERKQK